MKLKAALIGLGRMGAEPSVRMKGFLPFGWNPISHAESMLSIPEINLVGLCDTDINKCKRFAKLYNVERYSTNYMELIGNMRPQLISIATRTQIRPDIINTAINNGIKAIYCEKPLCNNIRDAESLIEKIRNKSIIMAYGTMRRYMQIFRKAKEIVHSGEIGELIEITVESGMSQLLWTHPHSTDLILFIADNADIDYVQGVCKFPNGMSSVNETVIDDDPIVEHAVFYFKNGMKGIIGNSKCFNLRIACSRGTVTLYNNASILEIRKAYGSDSEYFNLTEQIPAWHCSSGTQTAFEEIVYATNNNNSKSVLIQPEEILVGLKMLFAIVHSSLNNGRRVKFEELNKELIITGRSGNFYV